AYAACTVCSPTRAAIMTGKYPARLHLTDWIPGHPKPKARLKIPDWTQTLTHDNETIAGALKRHGYVSASIGKWHLGKDFPDKHGFDLNVAGCQAGQPPSYFSPYRIPTLQDGPPGEYLTDRETDEACKFVEANRDKPFFLYLPHYCVHTPLQAKKDMIAAYKETVTPGLRHKNATYAAMIQSLDESVGRVAAKLEELKLTDRTIVIFTSDNGGLLSSTTNAPLRAGKGSSYEGGVRVPLIVKWPGVVQPGGLCEEPVISVDFHPTILDIVGARDDLKNKTFDGCSIAPVLRDAKARLDREAIFWHYPHYHPGGATPYSAVRAREWKLVEFFEDNRVELYNLKDDIGEKKDLAAAMPDKATELRKRLADWRQALSAQLPTPNPDYDPAPKPEPKRKKATGELSPAEVETASILDDEQPSLWWPE
ncbi:MAG: sulfatase, partial [Planctomycetota bacterium]|nr:sulfatase [Planctomycetota bacterium]